MSNYTLSTDFTAKDSLISGNPAKLVKGSEISNEFNAVATAVATKIDRTTSSGSAVIPKGTQAQRDVSAEAGYLRFNTSSGDFEGFDGTQWGPVGSNNGPVVDTLTYTATAAQTVFTLSMAYKPGQNQVEVFVNGLLMSLTTDYVETDYQTITFNSGLSAGDEVLFRVWRVDTLVDGDAANMSYLPAGTSAVTTTVQAKLRESVSVKDFGAVGDGVTDDTAAIQAAITYANSLNGFVKVQLNPSGTYITSTLTPKSGVLLDLNGATLKLKDSTNSPIIYDGGAATGSNFGVVNGTLDCNQTNNNSSNVLGGIWLNQWSNLIFEGLTIKNCSRVGLYLYVCDRVSIKRYSFIDSGTAAAVAAVKYCYAIGLGLTPTPGTGCSNVAIEDVYCNNLYGYGILVLGSEDVSIVNSRFSNLTYSTFSIAITISESNRVMVNNTKMVSVSGDNLEINSSSNVSVSNVYISGAGNRPLLIGQNTVGLYNYQISITNFQCATTGGAASCSLSYVFNSVFQNFNCDKGVSITTTAGTSGNNVVINSTFGAASSGLLINGFYDLYKVNFPECTYQIVNRHRAVVTGKQTITNTGGVYNIAMATLFPGYMTSGSRSVSGKISIQSYYTGSANQGSYQEYLFVVNDFGTTANLSAGTTVANAVSRALTVTGDAVNKYIVLTNGTAVDLTSSYTLDLVVPV